MLKVTMTEQTLSEGLRVHSSLTSDKNLNQDFKNIILIVEPDLTVKLSSYAITTSVGDIIEAQVVVDNELTTRFMTQLRLKDISSVLNGYKSLNSIYIGSIDIVIEEKRAYMLVHEKTKDTENYGNQFDNVVEYVVGKSNVTDMVAKEINQIDFNFTGEHIPSEVFSFYMSTLLPQVQNEVSGTTNSIIFKDKYIYTRNSINLAIMGNVVLDEFPSVNDFKLEKTIVAFILSMISGSETFEFKREDIGQQGVRLTMRVGNTIAIINTPNTATAMNLTNYLSKEGTKIVIDRDYFLDVLKQAMISQETPQLRVTVGVEGKEDSVTFESKAMKKPLVVREYFGSVDVAFDIKTDLLQKMVLGYATQFTQDLSFYLKLNEKGTIELTVEDEGTLWYTKIREVTQSRAKHW